jgi:hypothetical protein
VKRLTTPLALIVAGLLGGLVALEGMLRIAAWALPGPIRRANRLVDADLRWQEMMLPDEFLGYKLRPGLETVDSYESARAHLRTVALDGRDVGMRDLGLSIPGKPVALAVGDSYTLCYGVEAPDCWVRQLAERLQTPIANLGVTGYSSLATARMTAKYGVPLRPTLILAGVFLNDFKENLRFHAWTESGESTPFLTWVRRQRLGWWGDLLERRTVTYRLANLGRKATERRVHHIQENGLDLIVSEKGWWRGLVDLAEDSTEWQLMRQSLQQTQQAARDAKAELVVLLFPFKEQSYWHLVHRYLEAGEVVDVDRPYRMIEQFGAESGIRVFNLTEAFRARARTNAQLYLSSDAHWNAAGNHLAAEVISAYLTRAGIVTTEHTGATARGLQ